MNTGLPIEGVGLVLCILMGIAMAIGYCIGARRNR